MLGAEYSYDSLVAALERDEREKLMLIRELEAELLARLVVAPSVEQEATRIVDELRALGHDMCSFDASLDFQAWCGNWGPHGVKRPYELILQIWYREDEPRSVAVSFAPWPVASD